MNEPKVHRDKFGNVLEECPACGALHYIIGADDDVNFLCPTVDEEEWENEEE